MKRFLFMPRYAVEITELAIGNTNIRCVKVSIDYPGDLPMRHGYFPQFVSQVHEFRKRGVLEEKDAFFDGQKFAVVSLLIQVG